VSAGMDCIEKCVYKEGKTPDEFNVGLSKRKPVLYPFPQQLRNSVNWSWSCIEFNLDNAKKLAIEACDRKAIDFKSERRNERDWSRHNHSCEPDIIRLMRNAFFLRAMENIPSVHIAGSGAACQTLRVQQAVSWFSATVVIQKTSGNHSCVGSRDKNTNRWCSRTCCMYSLKLAHLLKEHTEAKCKLLYHIRAAENRMKSSTINARRKCALYSRPCCRSVGLAVRFQKR